MRSRESREMIKSRHIKQHSTPGDTGLEVDELKKLGFDMYNEVPYTLMVLVQCNYLIY